MLTNWFMRSIFSLSVQRFQSVGRLPSSHFFHLLLLCILKFNNRIGSLTMIYIGDMFEE